MDKAVFQIAPATTGLVIISRAGKARGCSTNTVVSDLVDDDDLPKRHHTVQTVRARTK